MFTVLLVSLIALAHGGYTPKQHATPNDQMCQLCQQGIGTLHYMLSNKEAQKEVIAEMNQACTVLPSSYEPYCKGLVASYGPTIIDALLTYTQDPRPLCRELDLCTQKSALVKLNVEGMVPFDRKCDMCKYTSQLLGDFLKLKSVQERVMIIVLNTCKHMPQAYEAMCTSMVESNFNSAVEFLIEKLTKPSDLCEEVRMCAAAEGGIVKYGPPAQSVECSICEYVAEGVGGVLNNKQTQDELKEAVMTFCTALPPTFRGTCSAMVEQNFDAALAFFLEKLENPKDLCGEIGMCTVTMVSKPKTSIRRVKGVECDVCMYTAEAAGGILQNKEAQKAVKDALNNICNQLPGTYRDMCVQTLVTNFETAMAFLIEKLENPMDLCKEVGMCSASGLQLKKEYFPKVNGVTCEVCELLINKLDTMLQGNKTVEKVKHALENLCAEFPWSQQCTKLVDEYAEAITKLMISELDPANICTKLGLCGSSSLKIKASLIVSHAKPVKQQHAYRGRQTDFSMMQRKLLHQDLPSCPLCMFMSGRLDAMNARSPHRKIITKVLKKVCSKSKLTEAQREECSRMVSENKQMIMKLTKSFQIPQLCKEIGECKIGLNETISEEKNPLIVGGKGCIVCEYLIGVLDTYLMKKSTKEAIIVAVHSFCGHLPRPIFVTECNAIIAQYGEELVQLFVDDVLAPVDICTHFGMC